MFVVGTETDHVAPGSRSTRWAELHVFPSEFTLLLTSGGHSAGNRPSGPVHSKRRHRVYGLQREGREQRRCRRTRVVRDDGNEAGLVVADLGQWLKAHSTPGASCRLQSARGSRFWPLADARAMQHASPVDRFRTWMNERAQDETSSLHSGRLPAGIAADPSTDGRGNRPGRHENLDTKVMDVLVVLAERAGQVVPREELLAPGCGPTSSSADGVLSRCIYELRQQQRQPRERHRGFPPADRNPLPEAAATG